MLAPVRRPSIAREEPAPVNPILAFGQIVVSIGLMASILLQARGAGLSSAFGGDSAVFRSRRGIEKRLFQFTIILGVLFALFSLITFRMSG
jgi:preprotein translocase subunit SecG